MAKLICKIDLGLKNQTVYIQSQKHDNRQTLTDYKIPTDSIADFIIEQSGISEVHLGGSKSFAEKIEKDVKKLELQKYSTNLIKFMYDI